MAQNINIEKIVSDMTLEEKLRQMQMLEDTMALVVDGKFSREKADEIFRGIGIGCVQTWPLRYLTDEQMQNFVSDLQDYLKNNTRLGIPAIVVAESLHGMQAQNKTVYPQIIGLSCCWDEKLIEEIAETISAEAESIGISQVFAPDLDLAREPRWGRVEETFGEDPYLTGKLGAGYTRGMQKSGRIAATLKHFVAHGDPENGINLSPVSAGERKLRELYLPAFEESMKAEPLSIMPAYSELDGKPVHASRKLLTDILRGELGFKGYAISDYEAIDMLLNLQKVAEDKSDAGRQALLAGVDLEAPLEVGFGKSLLKPLENGEISEKDIDKAVARILYVKSKLGILDSDYKVKTVKFDRNRHANLALKAAEESIVLLKNNGVLPLEKQNLNIAVIGPNADSVQLGDYCISRLGTTLLDGIKKYKGVNIEYCQGSTIFKRNIEEQERAVNIAAKADAVILALGGSSMTSSGVGWGKDEIAEVTCGEGYDCHDLRLPAAQMELAEKILDVSKKTVLVLQDGRPCAIPEIYDRVDAVIEAFYPGEDGGTAMAEILFGDVNPSGKLTVTVPKHVGQLPVFYNSKPSARGVFYKNFGSPQAPGRSYVLFDPKPYFEFGFGLSYTDFAYENLRINVMDNGTVKVGVDVKNTGNRAGKEVVQLYINDLVSSVTTPVKALKGFRKIDLKPNECKSVEFTLGFEELYLIDDNMKKKVEKGWFEISISNLSGKFYLTDELCEKLELSK